LTSDGQRHLEEWDQVLDHLSKAMARFVRKVRQERAAPAGSNRTTAPAAAKSAGRKRERLSTARAD
jgi:hypothetical protein